MTLPRRWPLHPAPLEGEALSSWLYRIACCYRMDLQELLLHDLDHQPLHDLDIDPPTALLDALHLRSGFDLDQLRGMSLAGLTPWLLDSLDPNPGAYDTYVYQLSVLLPPRKPRRGRTIPSWRAWLPKQAIHRACPLCLQEPDKHVLLLMWQLPLALSCPQHACWLEPHRGKHGEGFRWEADDICPRPASASIVLMDRRTWQALTQRHVDLPRRRVHAGVWFRLLRAVLEELNTPLSRYPAQAQGIRSIWERCGYPIRAGLGIWRPYETLDLPAQLWMLEAAAIAMQLIETGALTGRGKAAELFLPKPDQQITGCRPLQKTADQVDHWHMALAAAEKAIDEVRHDPEAARALFMLAMFGRDDDAAIQRAQNLFHDLGIHSDFYCHIIPRTNPLHDQE